MAQENVAFAERTQARIRRSNRPGSLSVVPDFDRGNLIPRKLKESTPRSALGTEFLIRTGIVSEGDRAQQEARRALDGLDQEFAELTVEERRQYPQFLGGSILSSLQEMKEVVMDYSGLMFRHKMEDFESYMAFVTSSMLAPQVDYLPDTA